MKKIIITFGIGVLVGMSLFAIGEIAAYENEGRLIVKEVCDKYNWALISALVFYSQDKQLLLWKIYFKGEQTWF